VTLDEVDAIRDKLDALATMPFEKAP
jgi:hypothetical protein